MKIEVPKVSEEEAPTADPPMADPPTAETSTAEPSTAETASAETSLADASTAEAPIEGVPEGEDQEADIARETPDEDPIEVADVSDDEVMTLQVSYVNEDEPIRPDEDPRMEKMAPRTQQAKISFANALVGERMVLRPHGPKAVAPSSSGVKKTAPKRKSSTSRSTSRAKVAKTRPGRDSPSSSIAPRSGALVKKKPLKRPSSSKSKVPSKKNRPNAARAKSSSGKKNGRK